MRSGDRPDYYSRINGELFLHKDGYHGLEADTMDPGTRVATVYVGLDGKPTLLRSGVAIFRSIYNAQGQGDAETCHGVKNEPALHRDGNHAWPSNMTIAAIASLRPILVGWQTDFSGGRLRLDDVKL